MAQLPNGVFNANDHEPMEELGTYDPIPEGEYKVLIMDSDMKPTKAGTGQYLEVQMEVISEGDQKGRYIWDRFNLINPNPKATEIANRMFSSLCFAVGKTQVTDSMVLHNIPFTVKVVIEQQDGRKPQNTVVAYKPAGAKAQAASPAAQTATVMAEPAETNKLPF